MTRILALLDGSAYSRSVCHHTAWIAKKLGAGVEVLHVLGRREGAASSDLSGTLHLGARSALLKELTSLDEQRAKLAKAKGHAILEDAKIILEQNGVPAAKLRLQKGDLLEAVSGLEDVIRAIMIGKRGEGAGFASDHLGSNLERIVRITRVPVFVASRDFKPISKVLVAYDGSPSSRTAIDRMAGSPVFQDVALSVVSVGPDEAHARATAEEAVTNLHAANITATARSASGSPDEALTRLASEEAFDLLVMGAYGHSRVRSLIIGSTTTAMIRSMKIPVLLYR